MKQHPVLSLTAAQREGLEARLAMRLSARLDEGAQQLPHDISERLRVARKQALQAARDGRLKAVTAVELASATSAVMTTTVELAGTGGQSAGMDLPLWREPEQARDPKHGRKLDDAPLSWGWRLALVIPVAALLAGLWGIHRYQAQEQVDATTAVDMGILTDELPPDAYSDPGFEAYLSSDTGPAVRSVENAPPEADGDLSTTETAPATATP